VIAVFIATGSSSHAAHKWGLKEGAPDLKSAGQLAFGPDGVLFVGDAKGAAVFAIDRGGQLTTGTAPARRAGFFFGYDSPLAATEAGWSIFDSTIAWALG
jgi:hypothetical protein